jgi:UDP-N-acetylglucosamine/UDP-N-acetylgalactosamine diphosphorylase
MQNRKRSMSDKMRFEKVLKLCKNYQQEHLLAFYNELKSEQQNALLDQIEKLDFKHIPGWIEQYIKKDGALVIPTKIDPAPAYPPIPKTSEQKEKYAKAKKLGEDLLKQGKVAGFVVAGGQGTRLGFDGPKGNFPISPIKKKTLFTIFGENILAASRKYGADIPWYVMTSPLNDTATKEIFEKANYFGLKKNNVIIFQQGTMPNFAFDGKILMADKGMLATSPDGHGGSLKALADSGALADMKKRGIEYLSYWQVDNPLVYVLDPLFIGLHASDGAEMSSKALVKTGPLEKVGNFCLVDGKVTVIEYSDLPDEQAHRKNSDGSLMFELGSIGIHMISISFIEKLNAGGGFALPFHKAIKKIPHIDAAGNPVNPDKPNGVKLETFVFDALPMAKKSVILQTVRSEEFAPVKNATGVDSAEVTHQMMIDRAAAWLESAGVKIPRKSDGKPDCVLEVAAGFSLFKEDIKNKADKIPVIKPKSEVYLD